MLFSVSPTTASQAAPIVAVYGDSLWDDGQLLTACDLCSRWAPGRYDFRNFARAGAQIWTAPGCDGSPFPDTDCVNGVDRALSCFAQVEGRDTCLSSNSTVDAVLLQFGTNDVRASGVGNDGWSTDHRGRFTSSLRQILSQLPPAAACVLVVPPPIWSVNYQTFNARLGEVQSIVTQEAATFNCVVADVFAAYLAYEATHGSGSSLAFYADCQARGSGSDCIHFANPPPQLAADVIDTAIQTAILVPESPAVPTTGAALLTVFWTAFIRRKRRATVDRRPAA